MEQITVKQGDFFILSIQKGYTPFQRRKAMQVMECWPNVMTVKCNDGCMTKEYDHFENVTDITGFRAIHKAKYFEDNRPKDAAKTNAKKARK